MNMPLHNIDKIGVMGARGFLGSTIVDYFRGKGKEVVAIDADNYASLVGSAVDLFINANGNSRRFWADQNPMLDFEASVTTVVKSIFDFRCKHYVLISSSDVYPRHDNPIKTSEDEPIDEFLLSPYGFHKHLAEKIVRRYCNDYLILRCSAMIGDNLKKGPVKDILDGEPLFITLQSKLQFILTKEVVKIIEFLTAQNFTKATFNVGGKGVFRFKGAPKLFGKAIAVHSEAQTQHYEMSVEKLSNIFAIKTSEEYLSEFLKHGYAKKI